MTIIFFSGNLHKAREIEAIFAPFRVRIYTDFMKPFEVVECGKSFSDNAKIKLNALKNAIESQGFEAVFKGEVEQKDCILMAEDSGICVESLDNFPNIFSARFANLPPLPLHDSPSLAEGARGWVDSTDSENVARLISELKAKGLSESKAQFISCVACYSFGNSPQINSSLGAPCGDLANFECSQTPSLVSAPKIPKNYESQTENPSVVDSLHESKDKNNTPRGSIFRRFCGFSSARQGNRTNASIDEAEREESRKSVKKTNALITTHGFLNGKVITQIKGANGFGYDPIFVPNGFESTLAEMPSEAKNALSHRKIALDLMRLILCPLSAKNLS